MSRAVVWTQALATGAYMIANEHAPQPDCEQLAGDIRRRAHELTRSLAGDELTWAHVDCVQMLRSRLADPRVSFVGAVPFERAWSEAWAAAGEGAA